MSVIQLLPKHFQDQVLRHPKVWQQDIEEFRLRIGHPCGVVRGGREERLSEEPVSAADLSQVMEVATQGSLHTALESVRQGYITVPGGHRLGLGGTAVVTGGEVKMIRDLSSITIRVARDVKGISRAFFDKLWVGDTLQNTLLLSPPGLGKTTLLRDLIAGLSNGTLGKPPLRVAVADERGEIAACYRGKPQLSIGEHTDVLEGCPKALAVMMLLRAHGPQVIAVDEITAPADVEAIQTAAHCGVTLLATAHGDKLSDLHTRTVYQGLSELFSRVVLIDKQQGKRQYRVVSLPEGLS